MSQLIITADIHGHLPTWKTIMGFLGPEDGLAIAGDLFDTSCMAPGGDYRPTEILADIKAHTGRVWLVQGNCDDSAFHMAPEVETFAYAGTTFLMAHGHRPMPDLTDCDVVIQGHTHVSQLGSLMGKIFLNPGSPLRPRGGHRGFARFRSGMFELVTLSGKVVDSLSL